MSSTLKRGRQIYGFLVLLQRCRWKIMKRDRRLLRHFVPRNDDFGCSSSIVRRQIVCGCGLVFLFRAYLVLSIPLLMEILLRLCSQIHSTVTYVLFILQFYLLSHSRFTILRRLQITVGGLAFGRGNAKVRTGDKLSNSRKTFREHTPRMTLNRLLGAAIFILLFRCYSQYLAMQFIVHSNQYNFRLNHIFYSSLQHIPNVHLLFLDKTTDQQLFQNCHFHKHIRDPLFRLD